MELPFKDARSKVRLDGGRVVMASRDDKVFLDISGVNNVGIAEAVTLGGDNGVIYRNAGPQAPFLDKPLLSISVLPSCKPQDPLSTRIAIFRSGYSQHRLHGSNLT